MTRKQLLAAAAAAQVAGTIAFKSGENRAPALNKDFAELTKGCSMDEICKIAMAFLRGWDLANLYG